MRLSPLSQVRSAITGKNRFPVTIRQIQVSHRACRWSQSTQMRRPERLTFSSPGTYWPLRRFSSNV